MAYVGFLFCSYSEPDIYDLGTFFEHKIAITPEIIVPYGLHGDIVRADEHDPLGGPIPSMPG